MRIYLVDDEPIVTLTLQRFLSDLGHEAISAGSARELLDGLNGNSRPVDLIISDLSMSGMDGAALIREVHRRYPHIAIVAMTGHVPALSPQEAIAHGVYAYLRKPIHLGELELLLVRISESRIQRHEASDPETVSGQD